MVLIHFAGRTGKFGAIDGPDLGNGRTLEPDYSRKHATTLMLPFVNRDPVVVLFSGGPKTYVPQDPEHDQSWGNYIFAPLLMWDNGLIPVTPKQEVVWFVYKPAYGYRWQDDTREDAPKLLKDQVEKVKAAKNASYVDCIEKSAKGSIFIEDRKHPYKERNWKLIWIESAPEFWDQLRKLNRPIDRLYYWGHARGDLWLMPTHNERGELDYPPDGAIIYAKDVADNSWLRRNFQAGKKVQSQFWGCNTARPANRPEGYTADKWNKIQFMAEEWNKILEVPSMGWAGTIRFHDIFLKHGQSQPGKDGKKVEYR
jgi:hypothetical protein